MEPDLKIAFFTEDEIRMSRNDNGGAVTQGGSIAMRAPCYVMLPGMKQRIEVPR
jgi:hypothetical protein